MKGYYTENGFMGYVDGRYMLFADVQRRKTGIWSIGVTIVRRLALEIKKACYCSRIINDKKRL